MNYVFTLILITKKKKVETELAEYKGQAKTIFKRLNINSEPRCSIESGRYAFQ